jgi:hypothetical protein
MCSVYFGGHLDIDHCEEHAGDNGVIMDITVLPAYPSRLV